MSDRPVSALMNDDFPEPVIPMNAIMTSSVAADELKTLEKPSFWDLGRDLQLCQWGFL